MRRRHGPADEGRENERQVETRVAAAGCPGAERAGGESPLERAAERDDGRADGPPPFGVRVEQEPRPVRRRGRARDEVGRHRRLALDERLLLGGERGRGPLVGAAVDDHAEAPLVDERQDVDLDLVRGHADLGEPEAVLLDEVEREHVTAGRADDVDGQLDVDRRPRRHRAGERGPEPVPEDRVAARVEPVVGELQALVASRAPRRAAGVLEHEPCRPARAGA